MSENTEDRPAVIRTVGDGYRLQTRILARLARLAYPATDCFAVRLATAEALVNAIKHGNGSDQSRKVCVRYCITPERFWIRIEDEGSGFNPDEVADLTDPANIAKPGGRGIMLMRRYMSEVIFNDKGNVVEMRKNRTAGGTR